MTASLDRIWTLLRDRLAVTDQVPFVMGICGAQGSGKSTLADGLAERLLADGRRVAVLSLDDLYLTKGERQALARDIHPLLATRGVPGTHDVALGLTLLDALGRPGRVRLPRFDKAADTRHPDGQWVEGPVDVILFEGWCVGAVPQAAEALTNPVNDLERGRDADARWRQHVNSALAGDYQRLFGRIHALVLLAAPDFAIVHDWRVQQEESLRRQLRAQGRPTDTTMRDEQVAQFIQFYERLTRHILTEMPGRADLTLRLDAQRQVI
jgi:D-glycerate 3-kinase